MKTIGLVVKIDDTAMQQANDLEHWLSARNCRVVRKQSTEPDRRPAEKNQTAAPADLFCVFVLGGDGTFLSAVRWIGSRPVPVLGVKYGHVGFLADTTGQTLFSVVEAILDGRFNTTPRMRLNVTVRHRDKQLARETVLNDVVINKGALARLARIKTYINQRHLTDYRADGLIVATPTGSTAYSLAAGGPIIHPAVPGILMTPICPFTLTNRPLFVPDDACITIRLAAEATDIMLTFDGQLGLPIDGDHTIEIRKDPSPVQMITLPDYDYFEVLKAKLKWSGSRV